MICVWYARLVWKVVCSYVTWLICIYLANGTNIRHEHRQTPRIVEPSTGWRRPIGRQKLQVIIRKRATNFRAFLRKMTYKDKASYNSTPPVAFSFIVYLAKSNKIGQQDSKSNKIVYLSTQEHMCVLSWAIVYLSRYKIVYLKSNKRVYLSKSNKSGPAEQIVNREQGKQASTAKPHKSFFVFSSRGQIGIYGISGHSKKIGRAERIVNWAQGTQASTAKPHRFFLPRKEPADRVRGENSGAEWRLQSLLEDVVGCAPLRIWGTFTREYIKWDLNTWKETCKRNLWQETSTRDRLAAVVSGHSMLSFQKRHIYIWKETCKRNLWQ